MIDVELPGGPGATALPRGFAACLASVTEVPVGDLPLPDIGLAHALGAWRLRVDVLSDGEIRLGDQISLV